MISRKFGILVFLLVAGCGTDWPWCSNCTNTETPSSGGTTGKQGPQGPQGVPGKDGQPGPSGTAGTDGQGCTVGEDISNVTITCSNGSVTFPKQSSGGGGGESNLVVCVWSDQYRLTTVNAKISDINAGMYKIMNVGPCLSEQMMPQPAYRPY